MKRSTLLWLLALVITLAAAVYQRMTGPTYPSRGTVSLANKSISYKLPRSHGGEGDCPVVIETGDPAIAGTLFWKRYNMDEPWNAVAMRPEGGTLTALLPHQPPAGKLEYKITLASDAGSATLPAEGETVIRFKGDVPLYILIPHVLIMFSGMLFSTRAGLELFNPAPRLNGLVFWTLGLLLVGGFILGPLVQKYAFDAYWTGWPYGTDLTDNKTALAILSWAIALWMLKRSKQPARWAMGAAIITMAVFMIPHSLFGSELKYAAPPEVHAQ